jgi:hypothetical protein
MSNDLSGRVFGRLTAIAPVGRDKHRNILWGCRCVCGGSVEARTGSLKSGNTTSCGCQRAEVCAAQGAARFTTHGLTNTPEHLAWQRMKQRCYDPNYPEFHYWGGRGITVCAEWLHDFEAFLAHLGPKPSPRHSLDRYPDKDGPYAPGNVRWATPKQQATNRRPPGSVTAMARREAQACQAS